MPSLESFKRESIKKEQTKKKSQSAKGATGGQKKKKSSVKVTMTPKAEAPRPKRRPAFEGAQFVEENEKISVVDMDSHEPTSGKAFSNMSSDDLKDDAPKFHFSFAGSELLRARFPKSIKLTETVVDEWMKDGKFENLPIEHPIVEVLAQKGLRQAKEVEQKVFAHPMVEKAVVQALTTGFKVQNAWMEARKRFKK